MPKVSKSLAVILKSIVKSNTATFICGFITNRIRSIKCTVVVLKINLFKWITSWDDRHFAKNLW